MHAQQARTLTDSTRQLQRALQEIKDVASSGESGLWVYDPHWQLAELLCGLGYETTECNNLKALWVTW